MSELVACPYCGGEAREFTEATIPAGKKYAHCAAVHHRVGLHKPDVMCPNDAIMPVEQWNTRPIEDGLRADLDAAKAEADTRSEIAREYYARIIELEGELAGTQLERNNARAEVERLRDMETQANVEHEIWSSWMRYMFTCGTINDDGTWTMPKGKVEHWQRQMKTPYSELTEREKDSDREQVRKHWVASTEGGEK